MADDIDAAAPQPIDWPAAQIGDFLDVGLAVICHSGRVRRWNKWLVDRSGVDEKAAHGKRLDEVFPELSGHLIVDCVDQALKSGLSAFLSHRLHASLLPLRVLQNGKPEPISQNIVVKVLETAGAPRAVLIQVFDVSGTHRNEMELRRRKRMLEIARKQAEEASEAKTMFLANVSHELRTPLNSVIGFAELLRTDERTPLVSSQLEMVELIEGNGRRLLALIGDLLELSRIEGGSMTMSIEPVDLSPLLFDIRHSLEPMAKKFGVTIDAEIPAPGRWIVLADRLRLNQVLSNFGSNAIKYNRPGGRIGIVASELGSDTLRISISDTGHGLSAAQQADLFKPFQRLGQELGAIEGTGIGLAISKRLADLMGAGIGVESQVDVGSTFFLDLPLDKSEATGTEPTSLNAEAAAMSVASDDADRRPLSILYVEDNPSNMMLMESIMRRVPDANLLKATNGPTGLDIARLRRPQAIVLDIDLPGMDGYEILRRLRADPDTGSIPVIALTAAAMPRDQQRGRQAGFYAYMTKPVDIPAFLRTLDRAVATTR